MPILVWDNIEDRIYEAGIDKGVLYLPNGSAVSWNGLTSIIESFNREKTPVYFDGMKVNDLVSLGSFYATMKAITYPDEFLEVESLGQISAGIFVSDQSPKTFGLCYRTHVGNAVEGNLADYKIHILYNVIAIPKDKAYTTITADPNFTEFEWELSAVPEEISGFAPTAHLIIDSNNVDPSLLEDIEQILYGSTSAVASIMTMSELIIYINEWFKVTITDNGDGTWTAVEDSPGYITFLDAELTLFQIDHANAIFLDTDTYVVS